MDDQNSIPEQYTSKVKTLLSEAESEVTLQRLADYACHMMVPGKHLRVVESITISWELDVDSGQVLLKSHPPEISSYLAKENGLPFARLYDVKETNLVELKSLLSDDHLIRQLEGYVDDLVRGDRPTGGFGINSPWCSNEKIHCGIIAEEIRKTSAGKATKIKGISVVSWLKEHELRDADSLPFTKMQSDEVWAFRVFGKLLLQGWDCMFLKDASMKYVYVNPAMARLTGMEQAEMVGRSDPELFGTKLEEVISVRDRFFSICVRREVVRTINNRPRKFLDALLPIRYLHPEPQLREIWGFSREIIESVSDQSAEGRGLPYESKLMRAALLDAELAAKHDKIVLLTGESGSGKDYLAQYIHEHSPRAGGPYFSINCAAVSRELTESELFGHERGAFTGAVARKRGLLELAEGGTLLLNEIGELPLTLQAKLLTFLDTRKFNRVGGEKEISVNARLIAATNRDLEKEVKEKRFRQDLFYRLNVVCIELPPLRKRKKDIPVLVREILDKLKTELNFGYIPSVDPSAMDALCNYPWPGNVRELRNLLERAVLGSVDHILFGKDIFPDHIEDATSQQPPGANEESYRLLWSTLFQIGGSYNTVVADFKRTLISEALRRSAGKKTEAARLLGISRDALYGQMDTLGISRGSKTHSPE